MSDLYLGAFGVLPFGLGILAWMIEELVYGKCR